MLHGKVRCHLNLHRGDWSITVAGKVIAHVPEITLANVTFKIRESARQRVVVRRCREVHAWAIGEVCDTPHGLPETPIGYNPYRAATFTTRDGKPVLSCQFVRFQPGKLAIALGRIE